MTERNHPGLLKLAENHLKENFFEMVCNKPLLKLPEKDRFPGISTTTFFLALALIEIVSITVVIKKRSEQALSLR